MRNKIRRFISSILVIVSVITLLPIIPYTAEATYTGDGDGDATVTGSGSYVSTNSGYRMWLIDDEGQMYGKPVDLCYSDPSRYSLKATYNTKIQPWTGDDNAPSKGYVYLFSQLNSTNFKGSMPRPIIYVGSDFVGQGKELAEWLTNGKTVVQPSYSSGGGGGGISYKPVGTKPGSSGGNSGSSGGTTSGTTPTRSEFLRTFSSAVSARKKIILAHQSDYTWNTAYASLSSEILRIKTNLLRSYSSDPKAVELITAIATEQCDALEHELPHTGWGSGMGHLSLPPVNNLSPFEVAYASNDTQWITEEDGTLILDIADIAFAGDGTAAIEDQGNINPLLNDNNLFPEIKNLPYQMDNNLDTIAANGLKIIIEPITWFQPAKVGAYNSSTGKYVIGDSPKWWFYGTPTTYASMMVYNKAHGLWHDGGSGKGGWYSRPVNQVLAVSLFITQDLKIHGNTDPLIYSVSSNNTALLNTTLQKNDKGYAMHYVMFPDDIPKIPSTHTYDYSEKDPNTTPHPAPDPTPPDKIPFVPGEPQEPGDPVYPEYHPDYNPDPEPGYKNTTRNIHIIKVYDIIHIDGTIEHVETHDRDFNPGTIKVEHEEDYKCVGYFTSEKYYGFEVAPVTLELEWQEFRENLLIPINQEIFWETEYENVSEKKGKDVAGTVKIGLAADPEFDAYNPVDEKHPDGQPKNGYYDTTLYVHLVKKEKIPETSTWDEPEYPPTGKPPVVPPNAPPDPFDPPITDPETDEPSERFSHYRIVKVYETEDETTGDIDTDAILYRFPTNPIVYIQDEAQKGKPDYSYHLIEWKYGDEFNGIKWNKNNEPPTGTDWDSVVAGVNAKGAGTTEAKVDLIDKENMEETVTLYVRLRRKMGDRLPGEIIIEQSQISKTIHSNDTNIGGRFGDYRFAMTIGDFQTKHTAYYNHGCCRGHELCDTCHGHTCYFEMPGRAGDNKVNFNFDLISAQDELEIKKGVNSNTDPKVYGHSGGAVDALDPGQNYPETVPELFAADNKYYYTSDGNDSNGAEYVTILWRGTSKYKDIPTLAKFKQNDITKRYGADNYNIPNDMLSSVGSTANKISNKKRASAPIALPLQFTFGLHDRSDITATASCVTHNGYNCIATDTQDYYPIEGTEFTYDFKAGVAIQFYAGQAKGLQAAPFGSKSTQPQLEKGKVKHKENNVIQGKQEVRFYPYIHMTYMLNNLKDAELEEQNRYETGSKKPEVRKDTYVLSEWESSVLPADAVTVEWENDHEKESLVLTSQQWSVHQKAVNGVDGNKQVWNGKNQVLPGGAIYQLSTPKENWTTVNLTTYQTVIDQKARSEYLSKDLSGDEYTESKVAKDHLDFINDAKEVLDNLKVVQWVNKNFSASTAWPKDFKEVDGDGALCLRGLGEKLRPDLGSDMKETANTDEKYYMRQQTQLSNFQNSKLSEWTKTIDESQSIKEQSYEGDLDVFNMRHTIVVYKLFTDTNGNVYLANIEKKYGVNDTGMDNAENDIKQAIQSMKDLNADTYAMGQTGGATVTKLCDKKTAGGVINSVLTGDVKEMDTVTSFITNFVSALTRNKGSDYTAEWAKALTDGKWYNEAFDGAYMVKQQATFNIGFAFSSTRTSALDPALCPQNKGQSDLYTKAFLSQFCLDSQSDATIAQGKKLNYLGTFKDADITMPDMESMYVSKKFYIPNANVQDLN